MIKNDSTHVLDRAFHIAQVHMDERITRLPKPVATASELRQRFTIDLSDTGRPATDVINDLAWAANAGLVGNTGPDFFGWVMGSSCEVGVAADVLTSAWGQNAAIYQTAPAAAVAEEVAAMWLLDLLDLPRSSSVAFTTGATMATYIGLSAARSEVLKRVGWCIEEEGQFGAPSVPIIVSDEAHTSVLAALRYLGFGSNHLIRISTDSQGRMDVAEIENTMDCFDQPGIVIAQAGHINSGSFDFVDEIADLSHKHNWWLHIDGAFGLWARCSTSVRQQTKGIDKADSWAVDGHKWLQIPYDSGYAIIKNSVAHKRAMSMDASYLNRHEEDGRNPADYGPELSRRARGFTTWATLQCLGRQGVARMIDNHCLCAKELASNLGSIAGIRILNDVCLNQIALCFVVSDPNSKQTHNLTDSVVAELQRINISFVSGANWRNTRIMRISVIAEKTTSQHVNVLASSIAQAWNTVQVNSG